MPQNNDPKPRRTFTPEFKQQIVDLYRNDKRKCDLIQEYDIANSLLNKWIAQATNTGSFKEKDILKQAALIFGRKQM